MENFNGLTQEERFERVQEFKRNLSARIDAWIKEKQARLDAINAEEQERNNQHQLHSDGYVE